MPKPNEVMRKAQGAPIASVVPTTQATIPTKWKRVSVFANIELSATYEWYAVKIFGVAYNYTTSEYRDVEIQRVYRSLHPTCATGMAVIDFLKDNARATITHIEILKGAN